MKNTYSDTELASLNNLVAAVFRFEQADSRVGRNKAFRAQARISVSGNLPETPPRATLGWPYSGLLSCLHKNRGS